ncbi:MAG TPA: hypothetical protein VLH14_00855, partial [Patescibacteria group bacterium]|nr:hypothetical protein [Patescibacteria group bacterium]
LAVLTAVTIGLYVFGVAGGIISIPIAGCIKVLVEDYFEDHGEDLDEPIKEEEPKHKKLSLKFFGKSED